MDIALKDRLEVVPTALAAGGAAVARHEGLAIFVERGLPGDRLVVEITDKKPRFATARILEVLEKGPDHVDQDCPHFADCGGCQWRHLAYPAQLRWKKRLVEDALTRIGKFSSLPVQDVQASPEVTAHRNRLILAASSGVIGLHRLSAPTQVFEVTNCKLVPKAAMGTLAKARERLREGGLTGKVVWRVGADASEHLHIVPVKALGKAYAKNLGPFLRERCPSLTGVTMEVQGKRGGQSRTVVLDGLGAIEEEADGLRLRVGPSSFSQTNPKAAALVRAEILAAVQGHAQVADLYSGVGLGALLMARLGVSVEAVESDDQAVEAAAENARLNAVQGARFVCSDVGRWLNTKRGTLDGCVVNPPRTGLDAKAVAELKRLAPSTLVYVSCSPPTLARDLAALSSHYEVTRIAPVDMFPHSHHVETVVKLARKA